MTFLATAKLAVIRQYGETRRFYVTDSPSQHALREVRRIFSMQITLLIMLAVAILLGISGPFGTLETMNFGPRLAYWMVTVPLTFGLGVYTSALVVQTTRNLKPEWLTRVLVAIATAFSVSIAVALLNWLAFGQSPVDLGYFGPMMLSVMATAAVIAFVLQYLSNHAVTVPNASTASTVSAPLLDRLDLAKRGALISLSVQDHYVEVTTNKGAALVLMRLSDAIRETAPVEGVQIHRSHWVALKHITAARREGDKAVLTLSDGRELPASRSNIKALKEHGILPR